MSLKKLRHYCKDQSRWKIQYNLNTEEWKDQKQKKFRSQQEVDKRKEIQIKSDN